MRENRRRWRRDRDTQGGEDVNQELEEAKRIQAETRSGVAKRAPIFDESERHLGANAIYDTVLRSLRRGR